MAKISHVNFVLGFRCNSLCSHCFVGATPDHPANLDLAVAIERAREVAKISEVEQVHFSGGEPFLYIDIISSVIDLLEATGKSIIISTGCSEFSSLPKIESLFSPLKRIDRVWVSLDSFHLENVSIENFRNFDLFVRQTNIKVGYSICYRNMQEFAQTLLLIQKEGFVYDSIIKQPVLNYGRAYNIMGCPNYSSTEIPLDHRCNEINLANIWPDGSITNCGVFAGRMPHFPRYFSLEEFLINNSKDVFSLIRDKYTLKEMADNYGINGIFNIIAPCAVCRSMLDYGLFEKITEEKL